MRRALGLADAIRGHVWPNPPVGCVVIRGDAVVAEAATHPGGRPHAERKALELAGATAAGATLYVTLEPCSHWGKTPPCADAIIKAGVARVVCAIQDPDPRVDGRGFAKLRDAGVEVDVGLCAGNAEQVMSGFFHRLRTGAPELTVLDQATSDIPDGVDAVIRAGELHTRLITRRQPDGGLVDPVLSGADLLAYLGGLGLTSVAVSGCDLLSLGLLEFSAKRPA